MELYEHIIEDIRHKASRYAKALPWEPITIIPIGDIQYGAQGCDLTLLRETVARGIEQRAYYIGMGDYVDLMRPTGRRIITSTNLDDSTADMLEDKIDTMLDELMSVLRGTEGRWIGLLHGHHWFRYRDGSTTDTRLAGRLRTRFAGTCALVRLFFQRPTGARKRCPPSRSLVLAYHHGHGFGQTVASPDAFLARLLQGFEADIYVVGHFSKLYVHPKRRAYMSHQSPYNLEWQKKMFVSSGGYLDGYQVGAKSGNLPMDSYVAQRGYVPEAIGSPTIYITPKRGALTESLEVTAKA